MNLHLGCGKHYLKGWVNADLKYGDVKIDLTKDFPWQTNTVDFIFNEHFIEHLTSEQQNNLLANCFRVLKKGGVIRICCPDIETLVKKYLNGTLCQDSWNRNKIVKTECEAINFAFYNYEVDRHRFMLDFNELNRKLKAVGFTKVDRLTANNTNFPIFKNIETRDADGNSLAVEAVK